MSEGEINEIAEEKVVGHAGEGEVENVEEKKELEVDIGTDKVEDAQEDTKEITTKDEENIEMEFDEDLDEGQRNDEQGGETDEEEFLETESQKSPTEDETREIQRRILEQYATKDEIELSSDLIVDKEMDTVSEASSFDRETLILRHKELTKEKNQLSLRNSLLLRKLGEYYRKKKIIPLPNLDTNLDPEYVEKKYHDLLRDFDIAKLNFERKENMIEEELDRNRAVLQEKRKTFAENFYDFQILEKSTSLNLKFATREGFISNEIVDKSIARQSRKVAEVAAIRFKYIMCRNIMDSVMSQLEEVERLEEGLQVKDYEKLQQDNEDYLKKLEDRDEDLKKQRNICAQYHEMIAHVKEEINCESEKCTEAEEALAQIEMECNEARARFGREKEKLKALQQKLIEEKELSGLLAYPKLHLDFVKTSKMIETFQEKQKQLQKDICLQKKNIKKRSRAEKNMTNTEQQLKTKPRLHRSVNLAASYCRC